MESPPPYLQGLQSPDDGAVHVYTDGSASTKTRRAGWAFVMAHGERRVARGGDHGGTISEVELLAIHNAMRFLRASAIPVVLHSDSQYAINALTVWGDAWEENGWVTATGGHVKHQPLVKAARRLLRMHREIRQFDIRWVRGHAGNHGNEIADYLAGLARRDTLPPEVRWSPASEGFKFQRSYDDAYGQHDSPGDQLRPA